MTCRYKLSDDDSVASELGGSEVVSSAIEVTVTVVAEGEEPPDSAFVSGLLHEANDNVSTAAEAIAIALKERRRAEACRDRHRDLERFMKSPVGHRECPRCVI